MTIQDGRRVVQQEECIVIRKLLAGSALALALTRRLHALTDRLELPEDGDG